MTSSMKNMDHSAAVDGPVVSEVGRSPSTLTTGQAPPAAAAAPNVMWATDATQVTTVRDGKVWIFGVAEHWNAELLGWHVTKSGTRFEATQALGMADYFEKQARFWGIAPSYAFVGEPETNGVIERLFRTLKEQGIHGCVFHTIGEVRDAVRAFAVRYNTEWLIQKNGFRSPLDAAPHGSTRTSCAPRSRNLCPESRVRYRCRATRYRRMAKVKASSMVAAPIG